MKFHPTNPAEGESDKGAFEEILEDYGENIFPLHPNMWVLKLLRTIRRINLHLKILLHRY